MKFTIEQPAALAAIGHVQGGVSRKQVVPILGNVLIQAYANGVRFTATDNDLELSEVAAARVDQAGATTAPAGTLMDAVRNTPAGAELEFSWDGGDPRLLVRAGRARFQVPTLPAEEFPEMPAEALSDGFTLPASTLNRLLSRVAYAMSNEATRFFICGARLHVVRLDDGRAVLRAIGVDGHRMAWAQCDAPDGAEPQLGEGVTIPRKTVQELRRVLDGAKGEARVQVSPHMIRVQAGALTATGRLIDAAYPDYLRFVPPALDKQAALDVGTLSAAVKRALVAGDKNKSLRLSLDAGLLDVSARNPEATQAADEIDVDYDGAPVEFGVNGGYLLETLANLETDRATLQLADQASPFLLTNPDDADHLSLIMPVRI